MGADFRYADGSREHQRKSARKEKEDFTQMGAAQIRVNQREEKEDFTQMIAVRRYADGRR